MGAIMFRKHCHQQADEKVAALAHNTYRNSDVSQCLPMKRMLQFHQQARATMLAQHVLGMRFRLASRGESRSETPLVAGGTK